MVPSMSRPANPYDNASYESFMKTLKREEIYANKYEDLENLRANIEEFIEQYYNRHRLHSALGYRDSAWDSVFCSNSSGDRSATMEFFENKENNKMNSKGLLGTGTGEVREKTFRTNNLIWME
jgi:putative transposase